MADEAAILTMSGFPQQPPDNEEIARGVQLLWQGTARSIIDGAIDSGTEDFIGTESGETTDDPWTWLIASGGIASVEHMHGTSEPDIRLSTTALTGSRPKTNLPSPKGKLPAIWQVAEEIAAAVPEHEWANVPTDFARNVDHYLYGAPRNEDGA